MRLNHPAHKTEGVTRTQIMRFHPSSFTGKERDEETGYGYFGARYMDHELMTMWLSVDPMADKYPSVSPYAYCAWSPVKLVDPDGREISTHTDELGNVVAVFNDGDNGVYKHKNNPDGSPVTKEQITQRHRHSTSAGGIRMGSTKYWDEFKPHDMHTGEVLEGEVGRILFGETWDPLIGTMNQVATKMGLAKTAFFSLPGNLFDIKRQDMFTDRNGVYTGKLLNGQYATAESAGNYLAGMNGATGRFRGDYINMNFFMRLAGLLHSLDNNTDVITPPYYGEIPHAGRRITEGFNEGKKSRSRVCYL